ncbi:AMP-binding protein [Streptomyces sp. NPDC049099]|uniref:AMP-binding protein n=1 Tax=Streptomyces sp. NPDC049099 TaxID=3155768 RepID=UPI0034400333
MPLPDAHDKYGALLEERTAAALADPAAQDLPLVEVLGEDGRTAARYTYRQMGCATAALRSLLDRWPARGERLKVGVAMGNTPEFLVADLALLQHRATEVPVPLAFSPEQAAGLLEDIDVVLTDQAGWERLAQWSAETPVIPADCGHLLVDIEELLDGPAPAHFLPAAPAPSAPESAVPASAAPPAARPDWICKVIHTSGTTSRPKGVRIRSAGVNALVDSLHQEMPAGSYTRYLSLVPFSLLIEQVTAVYLVLADRGTVVLLPPSAPLVGTSATAPQRVLPYLAAAAPSALVVTPALAEVLAAEAERLAVDQGAGRRAAAEALFGRSPAPLICCGGAPVTPQVLHRLEAHGMPVHEGYGLSENSSVVCWNTPTARRIGTVGRPLPHVTVRLAHDGELLVRSASLFAGYSRTDPSSCALDEDGWLHTGDLATIDDDGFVRIVGRKKNVIITASGRNVAPEWVEASYTTLPFVRSVAVSGDGLTALQGLFLVEPGTDPAEAEREIAAHGERHLSIVERVQEPTVFVADEDLYLRFFTVTGRPRRPVVAAFLAEPAVPDRIPVAV